MVSFRQQSTSRWFRQHKYMIKFTDYVSIKHYERKFKVENKNKSIADHWLSPLILPVSVPCLAVYKEGFYIALSNLPGNIFTIILMDSTGGKILLCESDMSL